MNILVIGGGISDERDASLRSAQSVYDAISTNHQKKLYDWNGEESWLIDNAHIYDVALPILHGDGGEDGQIQRLLESVKLTYLGSGIAASELCIDKQKTQTLLGARGIVIPDQAVVSLDSYMTHPLTKKAHVLKPITGGSSIDTLVVKDGQLDSKSTRVVFSKHPRMILEECIVGPEITVPVLDGYELPVIEIIPGNEFFDFETKYDGSSQETCSPDSIDSLVQKKVRDIALACHRLLGCRHLSRVDIMLDKNNNPYVIEVNTMPGLTDQSLFPKAAAYVGLPMPDLVEYFIQLASKS